MRETQVMDAKQVLFPQISTHRCPHQVALTIVIALVTITAAATAAVVSIGWIPTFHNVTQITPGCLIGIVFCVCTIDKEVCTICGGLQHPRLQ
jgi:hypothetical protein